jgi:hypothetical protein
MQLPSWPKIRYWFFAICFLVNWLAVAVAIGPHKVSRLRLSGCGRPAGFRCQVSGWLSEISASLKGRSSACRGEASAKTGGRLFLISTPDQLLSIAKE